MVMGVPNNIVEPFVGVDFDSSKAVEGSAIVPMKLLVMGQRLSTGVIDELIPYIATSPDEVALNSGAGSMLHRKAIYAFKNSDTVEITFVGIDDAATATAATYAWDLSGTATASGEYVAYIAGKRIAVPIVGGTTTGASAQTAMAAAITELGTQTQVEAAVVSETLTSTVRNAGVAAGDLDIRFHASRGERLPAGLTLSVVTATAGTVDPDVTEITAVLGTTWYRIIDNPYSDETNLSAMEEHLDSLAVVTVQRDAMCYITKRDTRANMITFGTGVNRNNKWVSVYPAYMRRQSTYELGSAIAAYSAVSIQADPSSPLHRGELVGIDALDTADKWTLIERNQLALAGVSTLTDDVGVRTSSTVTMYLKNAAGTVDIAYKEQNRVMTLSSLRYTFIAWILGKYPQAKLAAAADNAPTGQQIMTVETARDEAVAWFKDAQRNLGWVDTSKAALTQFKKDLRVQIDSSNPDRINWLLPPDLMNQFVVGSAVMQFKV